MPPEEVALPGFVWVPSDADDATEVFTPGARCGAAATTWRAAVPACGWHPQSGEPGAESRKKLPEGLDGVFDAPDGPLSAVLLDPASLKSSGPSHVRQRPCSELSGGLPRPSRVAENSAFQTWGYIYSMKSDTDAEITSTISAVSDQQLLDQTKELARHEHQLQITVLDHLQEIEDRSLHLRRGFGSLFDYAMRELGYSEAAAWRRIKTMRLCARTPGARERLEDGTLTLSAAAQLQHAFERQERGRTQRRRSPGAAAPAGSTTPQAGSRPVGSGRHTGACADAGAGRLCAAGAGGPGGRQEHPPGDAVAGRGGSRAGDAGRAAASAGRRAL